MGAAEQAAEELEVAEGLLRVVLGSGYLRIWGVGFRVWGSGFKGLGCRVSFGV